ATAPILWGSWQVDRDKSFLRLSWRRASTTGPPCHGVNRLDDGSVNAIAGPERLLLRTPVTLYGEDLLTRAQVSCTRLGCMIRCCTPWTGCATEPYRGGDCLADDAVSCELVSAPNSLLTGNLTGNFANSGPQQRFLYLINELIQRLGAKFPTQRNREFLQP